MRHFQLAHQLILLGELFIILCGAVDFSIERVGSCTEDVELAVKYTGSGTVDIVAWKFSKMTDIAKTLNILTSVCLASPGADDAFPVGRMTYDCDNTDKIYKVTISPFNSTSDTGTWEASVSVSGSYTDFSSINIECESTTPPPPSASSTTPPATTNKSPDIVIIVPSVVGGAAAIVILISIIVCLRLRRKTNRNKNNKDVPDTNNTYMSSF